VIGLYVETLGPPPLCSNKHTNKNKIKILKYPAKLFIPDRNYSESIQNGLKTN
jgi:hypothetical protein